MTTPTVADLVAAIAEVKRVTPANDPWTGVDIWAGDYEPTDIDRAIATILNAVVSGTLSPAATEPAGEAMPVGCGLPCGYDCNGACFDPPQPSETVAEAMECLLALVGTPIGRRKLGIEPDDERLVTVRSALRALKGEA